MAAERIGESSHICFTCLYSNLFGSNSGDQNTPDLQNTKIASDRGYMTSQLVFRFILASGADLIGTVKRAQCWPFTYDKKLSEKDKRTKIESKGAPTRF